MTKDDIIEELDRIGDLFNMAARMVEKDELDIAVSHLDEADSWSGELARDLIGEIRNIDNEEDED